jgi:transporter family protein
MDFRFYALMAALAAAFTAILSKLGVEGVGANLATAIRTSVVLLFAWGLVVARGEHAALSEIGARSWIFLVLSGLATAASWLAYFKALTLAEASRVAPIDKLSLAFTIVLSAVVLKEPLSARLALGALLMVIGALVTVKG